MPRRYIWTVRALFGMALLYLHFAFHGQPVVMGRFLLGNVFLAYIPVELSFHLDARSRAGVFWTLFPVWLLFYPNAPYMLTDLFHLAWVDPYIHRENGARSGLILPDLKLWFRFANMTLSVLGCALFGLRSLNDVTLAVMRRFRLKGCGTQACLVLAITVLASIGIYLGRFPRLHSVDIFIDPGKVLAQIASAWSLNMVAFVALMTVMQMAAWLLLAIAAPAGNWIDSGAHARGGGRNVVE